MKCRNCPAFWHTEDDGGCYINKLEDKKNGECKDGCRLGIKRIEKTGRSNLPVFSIIKCYYFNVNSNAVVLLEIRT